MLLISTILNYYTGGMLVGKSMVLKTTSALYLIKAIYPSLNKLILLKAAVAKDRSVCFSRQSVEKHS